MTTSRTNINYKNNYFKDPQLTPIHGEPTISTLLNFRSEIQSCTQSVDTMLGGGANSHLGLVCDATTYAGIPRAATYVHLLNPGQLTVTAKVTQAQIAQQ
eukprot:4083606-Ditylum_brightwellii.AAC.1